jgi:hypothetical protein
VWPIKTTDTFDCWFTSLSDIDRADVLAALLVLREKGPGLSRPYADTLKGSRYSNMKERRIQSRGYPLRAFLPLSRPEPALCFVLEIRSAMKNVFTTRCSRLLTGNLRTGLTH